MKKAHLLCSPRPSSFRRTSMYASFLETSGALYPVGFTVGYADLQKRPPKEVGADLKKRLPVRLPLGVSPKIGSSASEWKPIRELGKAERTDRPEAGLDVFDQPPE